MQLIHFLKDYYKDGNFRRTGFRQAVSSSKVRSWTKNNCKTGNEVTFLSDYHNLSLIHKKTTAAHFISSYITEVMRVLMNA